MLAIHALWSQMRLCFWAEDSDKTVKSPSQAMRSARPHPFAVATGSDGASGAVTLLLPSVRSAPLDSPGRPAAQTNQGTCPAAVVRARDDDRADGGAQPRRERGGRPRAGCALRGLGALLSGTGGLRATSLSAAGCSPASFRMSKADSRAGDRCCRVMSPCMAKKDSRHSPSGIAALSRSSAASAPVRHTPLSRDGTSRPGGRNHSDLLRCRRWIEMGVRIRRGQSRGGAQAPSGQRRCVCRAGLHGRVPLPRSVDPLRAIGVGDPWPPLQLPIGRS